MAKQHWSEIAPQDAVDILLPAENITGPYTTTGAVCPWPWEPQQMTGVPLGQYHCRWCGEMVVAGVPHPDYADVLAVEAEWAESSSDADGERTAAPW